MAHVHEVHEVHRPRRGRIWPAVVMLFVVLLLIGIIAAMIMNVRGSISWPAGGVEFGFRPHLFVTRIEPAASPTTRVAADIAPNAEGPEASTAETPPAEPGGPAPVK